MDLPNGCRCSEPKVFPSDWRSKKADLTNPWYISYRFYDANCNVKQVSVRGMNRSSTWKERKLDTEIILQALIADLEKGYNPITNNTVSNSVNDSTPRITPNSLLTDALFFALESAKNRITRSVYKDTEIVLNYIKDNIDVSGLKVGNTTRKNVIALLNKIGEHKKINSKKKDWSNNNYNHFRKYLGIVFGELVQQEIIISNPVNKDLKKLPTVKRIRVTLTDKERIIVKNTLQKRYPSFYRFVQIFFHSGARTSELLKVKGKDVNLVNQEFKVVILKGGQWIEVKKIIKNIALPFWQEAMKNCTAEDYVFSVDLVPGSTSIDPAQISRRWNTHIKDKLKISADFYSLKHLHTDEIAKALNLDVAKNLNHQTSNKTAEIYAQGEKERRNKKIRQINNTF